MIGHEEIGTLAVLAVLLFATGFCQAAGEDLWDWLKERLRNRKH
jgi:hypothetical protein